MGKTNSKVNIKKEKVSKMEEGLSQDTKTVIVVLLLLFVYPIGLVLMFMWMDWPKWIKFLLALPVLFGFLVMAGVLVVAGLLTFRLGGNLIRSGQRTYFQERVIEMPSEEVASPSGMIVSPTGEMIKK